MPHMLIKYAHVLICISAGEGSRHFSAFHFYNNSCITEDAHSNNSLIYTDPNIFHSQFKTPSIYMYGFAALIDKISCTVKIAYTPIAICNSPAGS